MKSIPLKDHRIAAEIWKWILYENKKIVRYFLNDNDVWQDYGEKRYIIPTYLNC